MNATSMGLATAQGGRLMTLRLSRVALTALCCLLAVATAAAAECASGA